MKIIIPFGKPGAGKGTLNGKITKLRKDWKVLSVGAALRQAVKEGTEVGKEAKSYMDAGKLVPDEVVIECVKDYLAALPTEEISGIILDGFPRTVSQAEAMAELGLKPDKVWVLDVSDETVIERLSSRVECSKCKEPYSTLKNSKQRPKQEGVCDKCGAELVQRDDDKPETVRARLAEYAEKTEPVLEVLKEMQIPIVYTTSDADEDEIEALLS